MDNFPVRRLPPDPPENEFAPLTSCSIGRGAVAPSQTLPMRFATNRNHGNGRQHDCRKPKRRSPGRSSNGRQPREWSAATDPKEASGEKRGGDLVRFPARNRFGEAPTLRETRKDQPVRSVARTRPFRSDNSLYPNRFGAFSIIEIPSVPDPARQCPEKRRNGVLRPRMPIAPPPTLLVPKNAARAILGRLRRFRRRPWTLPKAISERPRRTVAAEG